MTYVDAFHDKNTIKVVERVNGKRVFQAYPAEYTFYYDDPNGDYQTVYRTPVRKFTTHKKSEFLKEVKRHEGHTWESDIQPTIRCLERHYIDATPPKLNVAFFDIEVDFDREHGFAPPEDPFNKVTAITVYLQWVGECITLAIPPKNMSMETANNIAEKFGNTIMFEREEDMFMTFFDVIEDADVLSGWNSGGFDIPYMVNRISRIMSKDDNRRWCLWNQQPKKRTYEKFGAEQQTYDLIGRVHLDYLDLYQKYTYHEMHSYSLDAIGAYEVDEKKVEYEGTLDQLYNDDFEKFIEYNRQDVLLIDKIDKKLDFIALANSVIHENTVLFSSALGAVATTEQGIINETHKLGFIVPDKKKPGEDGDGAAGAYVAHPKKGLHDWVGSIDINSLYPSTLRALNMAPETIVGQLRPVYTDEMIMEHVNAAKKNTFASAWEGHFSTLEYEWVMERRTDVDIIVDWDELGPSRFSIFGRMKASTTLKASEVYSMIFESGEKWMLSANGTIFSYEHKGIIPGLLEQWYAERKRMQRTKGRYLDLRDGLELPQEIAQSIGDITGNSENTDINADKLVELIDENNINGLKQYVTEHALEIVDGKLLPLDAAKEHVKYQIWFWDKRQHVKKILLNSLYGALLNKYCRFYDHRLGQSTTLTGRTITKHMAAYVNECIMGEYDYIGESITYGDTDSVYFSAWPKVKDMVESGDLEWNVDIATDLYENIADMVNESFPPMMEKKFNCPLEQGAIIKGGREITASKALFISKKRYAALVIDQEGERMDVDGKPGKLKAMGLDLKRADTPVIVQDFLKDVLMDVLTGKNKEEIFEKVREFKKMFSNLPSWEKGIPRRVNKLTYYNRLMEKDPKATIPGHVRASINYNNLRKMYADNFSMSITDGQKIVVCYLRDNPLGYSSIAYPVDIRKLPEWFKDLPFDDDEMLYKVVDKKLNNLLDVLNWDINENTNISSTFSSLFTFK